MQQIYTHMNANMIARGSGWRVSGREYLGSNPASDTY